VATSCLFVKQKSFEKFFTDMVAKPYINQMLSNLRGCAFLCNFTFSNFFKLTSTYLKFVRMLYSIIKYTFTCVRRVSVKKTPMRLIAYKNLRSLTNTELIG